jgi:hypothetical protein
MPMQDHGEKVMSIDLSSCTATLKDTTTGATRVERCDSPFFDPPHINPAG